MILLGPRNKRCIMAEKKNNITFSVRKMRVAAYTTTILTQ